MRLLLKPAAIILLGSILGSLALHAGEDEHYNEIYGHGGHPRPIYSTLMDQASRIPPEAASAFSASSRQALSGDNSVHHIPRLIDEDEYRNVIQPGISQRSRALIAFLKELYSGGTSFQEVIPQKVLDRIMERYGEKGLRVDPQAIAFPYGPDLIRDRDGNWRVIEDSIGSLGGMGDLVENNRLLESSGLYQSLPAHPDPLDFFKQQKKLFESARKPPDGALVALLLTHDGDHEDERLDPILKELGFVVIHDAKKLRVVNGAAYVATEQGEKRVGFLYSLKEPQTYAASIEDYIQGYFKHVIQSQIKYAHGKDTSREQGILRDIEQDKIPTDPKGLQTFIESKGYHFALPRLEWTLKHRQVPGLSQLLRSGALPTNYTPNVDFLNDKEFYAYVDGLIHHYLHEEPILKSIPTRSFIDEEGRRNDGLIQEVEQNPARHVIKAANGRGGKGVLVGKHEPFGNLKQALTRLRRGQNIGGNVDQEYVAPSLFGDSIVDYRFHSAATAWAPTLVSETGWGRMTPLKSDGKVNLSGKGVAQVLLTVDSSQLAGCIVKDLSSAESPTKPQSP